MFAHLFGMDDSKLNVSAPLQYPCSSYYWATMREMDNIASSTWTIAQFWRIFVVTFSNLHASPNNRMSMRQDSIIVQIQDGASMAILQLSNFFWYYKLRSSMHLNIAYFAILMQGLVEVSQGPQSAPLQVLTQPRSTKFANHSEKRQLDGLI